LFPGQPGAAHLHLFFGNDAAAANSTYESLRKTGGATCYGGPMNRTAYWMPTMHNGQGKVIVPRYMEMYYAMDATQRFLGESTPGQFMSPSCPGNTAIACPTYGVRDIPKGFKAISGKSTTTGATLSGSIYWSCLNPNTGVFGDLTKDVIWDADTPSNGVQNCTNTNDGTSATDNVIQWNLLTSLCWNGLLTDGGNHHTMLAERLSDGIATLVCPASHPYMLPSILFIGAYDFDTNSSDYSQWYLSSDRFNGATFKPGKTMHADFLWAWSPTVMQIFVDWLWALDGVNQNRTAHDGDLGNGQMLHQNSVGVGWLNPASRLIDPPSRGGARGRIRSRIR
jgi:hypothetical protein